MTISYRLLGIVQEIAPDGDAQEALARKYRTAQESGASETDLQQMLAGLLVDGLKLGFER